MIADLREEEGKKRRKRRRRVRRRGRKKEGPEKEKKQFVRRKKLAPRRSVVEGGALCSRPSQQPGWRSTGRDSVGWMRSWSPSLGQWETMERILSSGVTPCDLLFKKLASSLMLYLHSEVYIYIYICGCKAFKALVSLPGIKLVPSAVRAQSLKHWTAREFPYLVFLCFSSP